MALRTYTYESVQRALTHHVTTGAIRSVRPGPNAHLLVDGPWGYTVDLTLAQAYGLCLGLRAGEVLAQRKDEEEKIYRWRAGLGDAPGFPQSAMASDEPYLKDA
jgi:hypothetical protein